MQKYKSGFTYPGLVRPYLAWHAWPTGWHTHPYRVEAWVFQGWSLQIQWGSRPYPTVPDRPRGKRLVPPPHNECVHVMHAAVLLYTVFVCALWHMRRLNFEKKRTEDLLFGEWKHSLHTCCLKCLTIAATACHLGDVFNPVCISCGTALYTLPCTLCVCWTSWGFTVFVWPIRCFLAF